MRNSRRIIQEISMRRKKSRNRKIWQRERVQEWGNRRIVTNLCRKVKKRYKIKTLANRDRDFLDKKLKTIVKNQL